MRLAVFCSVVLVAGTASAERGVVWVPQPVRAPVAPEAVAPIAPYVAASVDELTGELTVGPRAAAALWLDPLDVVRVRARSGVPRFARVVGGAGTRAVLDEPGIPEDRGVTLLAQPPGRGDVWIVWARERAVISVERPVRRRGRLVWDEVEREVMSWIDRGDAGAPPELPLVGGTGEARLRLLADRRLPAARRRARARALLLALRPLVEGPFALRALALPGASGEARLDRPEEERFAWQRHGVETTTTVELDGPGVVRLEARALLPGAPVRVTVRGAGRLLAAASNDADPVGMPDERSPPPAFPGARPPLTAGGVPVGELASATAVLADGRHRYELGATGGPMLVRAIHARRRPRLGQRGGAGEAGDVTPVWPPPAGASAEERAVLFLDEARRVAGDDAALRALVDGLRELPPAELLAPLAEILPEPTLVERARSAQVAALELAWRARPLDPDVRARYRAAWRSATYALVPPDDDPGGRAKKGPRPSAWTWLVEQEEDDGGEGLPELPLGEDARIEATPAPGEPARAARLDVYVRTTAEAPGPLTLHVGERAWSTLALAPLERLEVAVPLGASQVRLDGPPGTRAWSTLRAAAGGGHAELERYWPLAEEGRSLRYELPDAGVPGPVRIALRVLEPRIGEPVRVAVRTDAGERRTIEIVPGGVDEKAMVVDAPGRVSGEVAVTLRLPAGTRVIWLTGAGTGKGERGRVVASVMVRRGQALLEPGTGTGTGTGTGSEGERILEISRRLQRGMDVGLLIERAQLLLDLDQAELARQDVLRLSGMGLAGYGARVNALLDRLEGARESRFIGVEKVPMALAPGMLGVGNVAELEGAVAAVKAARLLGDEEGLAKVSGDGAVASYLRARWSGGLAAFAVATDHVPAWIEAATTGPAALVFGVATRAREHAEHPRARRAFAVAAATSRWDVIEGTEGNAGQERVIEGRDAAAGPGTVAREALLAPPWDPATAHTLQPGAVAAVELELSGPTRLTTQVFCAELRAGAAAPGCVVGVNIDGQELRARAAAGGGVGTVPPRTLGAGRHRIEVTLARDEPRVLASVRFLTDRALDGGGAKEDGGFVVPIERPRRFFAATAQRPVVTSILGPTTLRVELRGSGPVRIVAGAVTRDVEAPGETMLIVPEGGAQRVTITPRAGRVLARLALRVETGGAPPPLPSPWWEDAAPSSLLPWPALPAPLVTLGGEAFTACTPGALGTISGELTGGGEPLGERDEATSSLMLQVGATYRRRLGDAPRWFRFGVAIRGREGTGPIAAASAAAYLRDLPLGLRAELRAGVATQAFVDEQAAGVIGSLRLDRSFDLGATLSFVPGVTVRGAWLSLDRATVTASPDAPLDPDVYNDFLRTRPLLVTGRAALWWAPYQDQLGELALFAATSQRVDHLGLDLEWRALFPVLGETFAALGYRPSYRLVTPDRPEAFLRHDLGARLRWSLWTGSSGRFLVGLDASLHATSSGARAVAGLLFRYDWTSGRGLRDLFPTEESFDTLVERLRWEPTPPGEM